MIPGLGGSTSIQSSNDQSDRQQQSGSATQRADSAGLRQYGQLNIATGQSQLSAAATAVDGSKTWLYVGLAVIAAGAAWLIFKRKG